jgi:hypothetical protein
VAERGNSANLCADLSESACVELWNAGAKIPCHCCSQPSGPSPEHTAGGKPAEAQEAKELGDWGGCIFPPSSDWLLREKEGGGRRASVRAARYSPEEAETAIARLCKMLAN